ncbi:hypothetical protein PISMIDRAFT_38883, partial [Pisolithus microcarpus 441]
LGIEPMTSKAEATTCTSNIHSVIESTKRASQKTADWMVKGMESSHSEAPEYTVSQELTEKWIRPYKVLSVKLNAVELCLPKTLCIHMVVNVSCMKPYRGP